MHQIILHTSLSVLTIMLLLPSAQSQAFIPSQIVEDENQLFRSNTVSLLSGATTTTNNQSTTTVLYTSSLFSTSYQILTSITTIEQSISTVDNMLSINITIKSLKLTGFTAVFSSPLIGQTSTVKLSYITIDQLFRSLNFYTYDNYLGDDFPGLIAGQSLSSEQFLFDFSTKVPSRPLINTYGQYKIQPFLKGYEITNNNCQQFSISIQAMIINSTYYSLKVKSKALTSQYISKLYVTILAYNSTYVLTQNTLYQSFSIEFQPLNSMVQYSSFGLYKINLENYFVGVQQFTLTNNPTTNTIFQYDIANDFVNQKSILSSYSPSLTSLTVFIIKLQRRSCTNPAYPYFMNSYHRCYPSCPVRFWQDNVLIKCQSCLYDCFQCVNGSSCTACNSTHYFREDNILTNGTLRCKPIAGYYSSRNNQAIALKCDITKCVQCFLLSDNCTKCQNGEYLLISVSSNNYISGSCIQCMANCARCDNSTTCDLCQQMYQFSAQKQQCVSVCGAYCQQCHIETLPILRSICDQCLASFYLNSSSLQEQQQCYSICGDGQLSQPLQQCDDNNLIDNDGCDSQCKQQPGYNCYSIINSNINNNTYYSQCYYQQKLQFTLSQLYKVEKQNTFIFNLTIQTLNQNILTQLQYKKIITIDVEYKRFQSIYSELIYYKQSNKNDNDSKVIDKVVVSYIVQYTQTIKNIVKVTLDPKRVYDMDQNNVRLLMERNRNEQLNKNNHIEAKQVNHHPSQSSLSVGSVPTIPMLRSSLTSSSSSSSTISTISTTPTQKFSTTPSTTHSFLLKPSSNHLSIIYQPQPLILLSTISQYLFLSISIISIILLLCSMTIYGGKIITLQYLLLCNCAYYCLVQFCDSNIQIFSTLKAIGSLKVVALNVIFPSSNVYNNNNNNSNNPYYWMGIGNNLLINYLPLLITISIPLIISLVSFIIYRKTTSMQTVKQSQFIYKYSLGQLLYTFYLLSSYTFTVILCLCVNNIITHQSSSSSFFQDSLRGIVLGSILFIIGLIMFIVLLKRREYFWQFINTFYKSTICEYYVNFTTIVVWLNSIAIVATSNTLYTSVTPIILSVIFIAFLLKYTPYRNSSQRRRPIIIQLANILIQIVYLVLKIKLDKNDQMYSLPVVYHYLPIGVGLLLFGTLIYTGCCLFKKVKQAYQDRLEYVENQLLAKQGCIKNNKKQLSAPKASRHRDQNNNNNDQTLSSQKRTITIQKEILQELKNERGFNFLSLALSIDKKELDENWEQLQKVAGNKCDNSNNNKNKDKSNNNNNETSTNTMKQIKVRTKLTSNMKRLHITDQPSLSSSINNNNNNNTNNNKTNSIPNINNRQRFIEQNQKLKDYFKINTEKYSPVSSVKNNNAQQLQQQHHEEQVQQQSQVKQQHVNCGQNNHYLQQQQLQQQQQQQQCEYQNYQNQNQLILKPKFKSPMQKDQLHSLIEYDMI